jgi:hypothetical protein
MISIFTAYKNGLSLAWKERKMLILLYAFNLLFAYLVTLPFSDILSKALNNTIAADKVLQSFDYTTYTTIMDIFGKGVNFSRTITTIGILYLFVNIFFAGGILRIFIEEAKFSLNEFFKGCVEYFNRFLRLFLFSVISLLIAVLMFILFSKFLSLFTDNSTTEHLPFLFIVLRVLFLGTLLSIINMLFDYAKIMTVVNDYQGMYATIKQSMMFVMMSPLKTMSLYFSYLITILVLMLIYLFIESFISTSGWLTILTFVLGAQVFMISRIWIRMSFFAGQYSFYHYSNTAMPGLTKAMLEMDVENYEKRLKEKTIE